MKHLEIHNPERPEALLEGFLLTDTLYYGLQKKRPAVVILPGGGYYYCCDREGEPVAIAYMNAGFHAFVLNYSTGPKAAGFAPMHDVSWAIGLLRERAEEWNIDPDRIALCGFSAGGHLALGSSILAENKPNAMILGYPCVEIPNVQGAEYMLHFLSGKEVLTDADYADYNFIPQITKDAPPVFLMATAEDPLTQTGALQVANTYGRLGLVYEMHIFQFGAYHGYSLGNEVSADGCSWKLNPDFGNWFNLSVSWLKRIFGELEFGDTERPMN